MTVKELREITGLTQAQFSEKYGIPKRSIENWEGGQRVPPPYIINLLQIVIRAEKEKRITTK